LGTAIRWSGFYGTDSAAILEPLLRPPIAPGKVAVRSVNELQEDEQRIGAFTVRASGQPRHWSPTAGLRIDDELALITDTPYERTSIELAKGVRHLLHEVWSSSRAPMYPDRDATAADAARVAREAEVGTLTLIHLNPRLADHSLLFDDARRHFEQVALGEDGMVLI
jgi:ribonuclease BN (tRNA processing enzyme)